jgi:hypothetical protein
MNSDFVQEIVNAVLYEGYILYPYRASSKKNRRERFTFGRVYPEAYNMAQNGAEPWMMQTECLVRTVASPATLDVRIGFLHPMAREIGAFSHPHKALPDQAENDFTIVPELTVGNECYYTWHEAVERTIDGPLVSLESDSPARTTVPFAVTASRTIESIRDGQKEIAGVIVRRQEAIAGKIEISVAAVAPHLRRVTIRISNESPLPENSLKDADAVLLRTFASTHTILSLRGGEFISLLDPSPEYRDLVAACSNVGAWPVLVGDEKGGQRDTMLSSPIILYDYPKIAPESAGPLFDGTEIDEILTLRILTMTDQEKREMSSVDEQARRLLERTEGVSQNALLRMHGTMRKPEPPTQVEFDDFFGANTRLTGVSHRGVYLQAGDRVRLRPKARADVLDLALNGQVAVIESVEQDLEKRIHLAVVLENDPGKDLGMLRQPGHRFFYGVEEVEPLGVEEVEQ